ncbi:high mobility group DSP1 [Brachionus plicatilis]|uniref:High mobility group DSP1 n=1 Tax=Brachionus plicatilis TaxID=10195 RepID=A0A3M7QB35_BRAPC|nr:high mobility group DSP1 [Brachionus plicatilis]
MASYAPPTEAGGRRKKKKKDPNAPKRPLSAFFLFCADERPNVKALYPQYSVGEAAKELGERWNKVSAELKAQYEAKASQEKQRYERELEDYKNKSLNNNPVDCDEEDDEE